MSEGIKIKPSRKFAGHFQDLKYRILRALNGKAESGFVLAFASCDSGEGVTSIAANFAATMASESRRRVLLIDADLRMPSLQSIFDEGSKSVMLRNQEAAAPHVEDNNLLWRISKVNKNMDVLMVHRTQSNPVRIFEASWFNNRLNSIRERYDVVIIDAPPLNSASGALVLATKADGMVLVLESGKVRKQVIQRNIDVLLDTGVNLLGVVMNKRKYPIPEFIYNRL